MKIGLVRHYKVNKEYPSKKWLTKEEVIQWFHEYDTAEIEYGETDLMNITWKQCYSSDLPRAVKTSEKIYQGPITQLKELREIPLPTFKLNVKLPFLVWGILIKLSWLFNPKVKKDIKKTEERIALFLDQVLQGEKDTLIVSHAALMKYLRKELLKRGYEGPKYSTPDNGRLYLFSKSE